MSALRVILIGVAGAASLPTVIGIGAMAFAVPKSATPPPLHTAIETPRPEPSTTDDPPTLTMATLTPMRPETPEFEIEVPASVGLLSQEQWLELLASFEPEPQFELGFARDLYLTREPIRPQPVHTPEPGALALLTIASFGMLTRRRPTTRR